MDHSLKSSLSGHDGMYLLFSTGFMQSVSQAEQMTPIELSLTAWLFPIRCKYAIAAFLGDARKGPQR